MDLAAFPTFVPVLGEGGRKVEAGWAGEVCHGGERGATKLGLTCCNVLGGNLFPR